MFECPFQRNKKLIQYRRLSCGKQGDKNGRNENRCGRNGFPVLQAEPEWEKELPVRSSEMGLLSLLVTSKEKITPKAAADFFGVSKPMIASMVKSLTLGGYIRKEAIEQDKRKYILIPEAKAVSLVEATRSEYVHTMTLLENGMGKQEFSELMRLLEKANAVLQLERKGNNE